MQALPGFRDFYPDECERRNRLFAVWRDTAQRYGFREVDGPPLEPLDLYTKKSGEEIVGQLYHFEDKGGRAVALRPELTPTFARLVAARHRDFKKPIKWFAIPQLFRYERPQKGRLREHFQLNADIVGAGDAAEDVEIVALLIDTLGACGLTARDAVVRLSSRELWHDLLRAFGVAEDKHGAVFAVIDKIERMKPEEFATKLETASGDATVTERVREAAGIGSLDELVSRFSLEGPGVVRVREVLAGIAAFGLSDWVRLDLRIVRGLAYYTGVVFEAFELAADGALTGRAVAGGGRYDRLLKGLTDVDLPAAGFGMGDVVLGDVLKEKGLLTAATGPRKVYVVRPDATLASEGLALVRELRQAGFAVDYSMKFGSFGKQMQAAEESGAVYAVIADAALASGSVSVKRLATREQVTVPRAELVGFCQRP